MGKRIVLVALHFAEYSISLAKELARQEQVLLILYKENVNAEMSSGWISWAHSENLEVIEVSRPKRVLGIVKNSVKIYCAIRNFNADVIHFQEEIRDELVPVLLMFPTIRKVLTVHDPVPHIGRDANRLQFSRLRLYRYLMRRMSDAAIVHGAYLRRQLELVQPHLEGSVYVIPHGALGLHLRHQEKRIFRQRREALFFGRIHEYKGLKYFIEAISRLRSNGVEVTGVVAGRGDDLNKYRDRLTKENGFRLIDQYVSSEMVAELFSTAMVVVLPYIEGTQSGVAAMAVGFDRAVVATKVGSIPELVSDQVNGLLVPAEDVEMLAQCLEKVFENDELRHQLEAGAKKRRLDDLSWSEIARRTKSVYFPST